MAVNNFVNPTNVNDSSVVLAAQSSEMGKRNSITSVEIAEEAGRNHKDVMRSIREMESAWVQVNGRKFALVEYIDKKGELRPCYQFAYEEFMYVISKFDDITRAKLVTRWAKLETGQTTPMYQVSTTQQSKPLPLKEQLTWVKEVSKIMKLNDASTLGMLQQIAQPFNLPVPDYTPSKGFVASATTLLEKNGLKGKVSAEKFNLAMESVGYIERKEKKTREGVKKYPVLTEKGLKWGENQVAPQDQRKIQIQYYEDKFPQLLEELGFLPKGE